LGHDQIRDMAVQLHRVSQEAESILAPSASPFGARTPPPTWACNRPRQLWRCSSPPTQ
jgi:hypothetical protein